jgi:NAD(P)-dependent dehydrogenase (short-subunit alcohol dehydrogenase family)
VSSSSGLALITGGKARIGYAIASGLADAGWDIVIHYNTDAEGARSAVCDMQARGVRSIACQADLSDPASAMGLIATATSALGPVTALINNASLFERDDWDSVTAEMAHAHYAVNVVAPLLLSQAFAKALGPKDHGCIVNIIDQRVLKLTPAYMSYALSKSALWTLTRTLAQALAPNIRVNAVGPGPTLANARQSTSEFLAEAAAVPLKKAVSPDEIAKAVCYLLNAQHVTGQMIAVDSGQHLGWETPDALLEIH